MSKGDIHVTLSVVDRVTPELLRVRYKLLTPVGRRIPPKGTYHRQVLELHVRLRQFGRAIAALIPGGSEVPWREIGAKWGRRLEWLGVAYIVIVAVFFVALFMGWIR